MKTEEQAVWAEVEAELMDLWMAELMDHDEVIIEDDLNDKRDGGPEISGGEEESA